MLSLKDLGYLLALKDLGHFGKAAQACHVSQPTLSGQIKKLQATLGVQLLESGTKKVIFTHVGLEMAHRAKQLIVQANEMEAYARTAKKPLTGLLRLAVIPSLAPYLMAKVGEQVASDLPDLNIELHELETQEILRKLKNGDVDVGIMVLTQPQAGLRQLSLWQEPLWLGVNQTHPWADKAHVTRQELAGAKLILLKEGHCLADQAAALCQLKNLSSAFRGASLETLRYMICAGKGATLVPQLTKDAWQSNGDDKMIYIPIAAPTQTREIGFVARSGSAYWPCVEALEACMNQVLPSTHKDAEVVPLVV